MDTENTNGDDLTGLSAASLAGTAIQWQRELRSALTAVQAAQMAQERGAVAIYGETVPDFEARQRRLAAERHDAEARGRRLERESWEAVKTIRAAVDTRGGLGLTAAEWRDAAGLAALAESMMAGSLEDVTGTLRSAAGSGDKARAAAFLAAAEARLRGTPDGLGADDLRSLAAQVRYALRDETFDRVHAEVREVLVTRGELGAAVVRRDAEEAVARVYGGRGVAIPSDEELKRRELAAAPYLSQQVFGYPIPDGD